MGADTFPGDPNPPPKVPQQAPQEKQQESQGGGTAVAERPPQESGQDKAAPDVIYRVVNGSDGKREVYMLTDDLRSTKLGTVGVEDADHVLNQVGTYDKETKTWDVPEAAAKSLLSGRLAFPEAVAAAAAGGEAGIVRSYNAIKFLSGEMSLPEMIARNKPELLKEQLGQNGQPQFAWNGLGAKVADALKHPLDSITSASKLGAEQAAGFLPMALEVAKGAAQGAAVAGGPALAAAAATGSLALPPVTAAVGRMFSMGALAGGSAKLIEIEAGTRAAEMAEQGYDEKTIKEWAPVTGAIKGALWAVGFKFLPAPAQVKMLAGIAESPIAKNWMVKYAGEVLAGAGLMVTQEKVGQVLNNMAAESAKRPDLYIDGEKGLDRLLDSGVKGLAGMAVAAVPGALGEQMGLRAQNAKEAQAAKETATRLEQRDAAEQAKAGKGTSLESGPESGLPRQEPAQGSSSQPAETAEKSKSPSPTPERTSGGGQDPFDRSIAREPEKSKGSGYGTVENIEKAGGQVHPELADEIRRIGLDPAKKADLKTGMERVKSDMTEQFDTVARAVEKPGVEITPENARTISASIDRAIRRYKLATDEPVPQDVIGVSDRLHDVAEGKATVDQQVAELMDGREKGKLTDEEVVQKTSEIVDQAQKRQRGQTFEQKTRDVESQARIKAIESDLKDQGTLITELSKVRDQFVEREIPTRVLDRQLNRLLDEEEGMRKDLEFYEGKGPVSLVEPHEPLLMKPATLENIVQAGFKEGRKEVIKVRAQQIKDIATENKLTQTDVRKLLRDKNIGLMGDVEFKNFVEKFKQEVAGAVERKQAFRELQKLREEKQIVHEQYVRQLNDLPGIHKMTMEQLRDYIDILHKYDEGDEALSPQRIAALHNTILEGVKTQREVRGKFPELTGRPLEDFQNSRVPLTAAATPDPHLREWHPALRPMVDLRHEFELKGARTAEAGKEMLFKLGAEAIKERQAQTSTGQRLLDTLVPQQRDIFNFIGENDPAKREALWNKLTPAEQKLTSFWQTWAEGAWDYMLKSDESLKSRFIGGKYLPHVGRSLLEMIRELPDVGLKKTLKEFLPDDEIAGFSEKGGMLLGFKKFMKQTLFRSGELEPSKNVIQAMAGYMDDFYRKVALDESTPVIDTLARSLRPSDEVETMHSLYSTVEDFTKTYLNNQKGINDAGGVIGRLLHPLLNFSQALASIHWIAGNIALQATKGVAIGTGEFMALGTDLGVAKVRKYTEQGRAILDKYSSFVGKGPLDTLAEPGRGLQDLVSAAAYGAFKGLHKMAMEDVLLGSMTKEEFKSGEISDKRLAEIKLAAGRWMDVSGMSSIAGSSAMGKTYTQFKSWAVPPLLSLGEDLNALQKSVRGQGKLTPQQSAELLRVGTLLTFGVMARQILSKDMEDDSFTGRIVKYVRADVISIWRGLDPTMFFTVGVGPELITRLAKDVSMLIHGEEYKRRDGYKGVEALKQDLAPVPLKHFLDGGKGR